MALIDELKTRRETATRTLAQIEQRIADENHSAARVTEGIADLDRAIAALEPAPQAEQTGDDSLCPKMPESAFETVTITEAVHSVDDVIGWNEAQDAGFEGSFDEYVQAIQNADAEDNANEFGDNPSEFLLSDEEREERIAKLSGQPEERPALDAAMQDEREAPVTNPEADEQAKLRDWYDPKAVAEREREESFLNRFNPFRVKVDA